jgi:hypothetical protein
MTVYVYHIHADGMGLDQGYVGISVEPNVRWSEHARRKENPILSRAIKKHGKDLKYRILSSHDTPEEALWEELTLRPLPRIGWNIARGGGMPPNMGGWNKGLQTPPDVRQRQSAARLGKYSGDKHPRARLANVYKECGELLAEKVVIRVWAKDNGYHQAHLAATATGKLNLHKGLYARYV